MSALLHLFDFCKYDWRMTNHLDYNSSNLRSNYSSGRYYGFDSTYFFYSSTVDFDSDSDLKYYDSYLNSLPTDLSILH